MPRRHSIAAILVLLAAANAAAQQPPAAPAPGPTASFTVFLQGTPLGSEQVAVTVSPDGWIVKSSGRLGNPVNISTSRFELRYDRAWRPLSLDIEATLRGQPMLLRTAFANGTATSEITQSGQVLQKTDTVAADAVVLPNMFFGAYEALALRLQSVKPPAELRAYIAPQIEIALRVTGVADERIRTTERTIAARRYGITFANQSGPLAAEVWVDEESRLLRFRVPIQGLEVARDDVAAVSSRVERLARNSDEQVHIPSNGFSLAGTLSQPAGVVAPAPGAKGPVVRQPAVILIPGSGPADRDESISGIPIFAQLAMALADAGFIVVRYDKRGVGQSGGRGESATIKDFAEDVRAVVEFLRKRKDVDPYRIAIVGHSEGGMVGMSVAADAKKQVTALVLMATPGTTGGELILEQQQHLLDRMTLSDGEKRNRMDLQRQIQKAVLDGHGWETIPAAYRRQADTAWFRGFLSFDPAAVMPKVTQPVLVIQGSRDRQVPTRHGELLAGFARARKNNAGADLVTVEGVNHLLVPAATGETDEYPTLQDKTVSAQVIDALTSWLRGKLHVAPPRAGQ
ncbi:MAG: alpha/beta fold hydrolase [Acidobacteria bacterium]|nr:alpha/beta fold hydrolase [Acidobacteriota bacterium]